MAFLFRPLLLLPAVAILVATSILWGGVRLSKQERSERVPGDEVALARYSEQLQGRLHSLESLYQQHLETLARGDLGNTFALRDAIDAIVGVRQISTLGANGQVDLHLLASGIPEGEKAVPLPVSRGGNPPVGRSRIFEIEGRASLGGGETGAKGWIGSGGELFYFSNVSERRSVFLLIDQKAVTASIEDSLSGWARDEMKRRFTGEIRIALTVDDRTVVSLGDFGGETPDLIRQLGSRFGSWQILSRDPRREVVEYDLEILAEAFLIALLLALAGAIAFFHLNRTLHLAERRVSFVNQVSHELKTPLTNILLNTDLALDGADSVGQKRLALVQEETRRLSRLIDNVLTYSVKDREPAALATAPHDLHPLVEDTVAQFRPSLERRGIAITLEGAESTVAILNPDAFSQILGNLLSNVEKYAAAGRLARIEFEVEGTETIVRVSDAGGGIPRHERERIFLPFHRLDDRTAEGASGTGLGLAIARDLATSMGGSLRLLPGATGATGATFELRLVSAVEMKVIEFPDVRAS